MVLLFSLFSPLVELFPNLYMSWWMSSNGNTEAYLKAWPLRITVFLVVWLPILFTFGSIVSTFTQLFLVVLVFAAFILRFYLFDQSLQQLNGRDDGSFIEPSKIPEVLYFIAFSSMGWVLYHSVPNSPWLVILAILSIFFGAFIMATFRRGPNKNLTIDVVGRMIFTAGFLLNLYNLARATKIY